MWPFVFDNHFNLRTTFYLAIYYNRNLCGTIFLSLRSFVVAAISFHRRKSVPLSGVDCPRRRRYKDEAKKYATSRKNKQQFPTLRNEYKTTFFDLVVIIVIIDACCRSKKREDIEKGRIISIHSLHFTQTKFYVVCISLFSRK